MNAAVDPPANIRNLVAEQRLLIEWRDGLAAKLPLVALRGECACARCVDEFTGQRILDLDGIDPQIGIGEMKLVGNYALKIYWSDGHNTGLYTWEKLRKLCQ